jgi:glutamate decarboxylase
VAQYYNFVRLGREGYKAIQDACYATAKGLADEIVKAGPFELLCDGNPLTGIPSVAWRIIEGEDPGYTLYDVADRLRVKGWQVPAYPLTGSVSDVSVQRILVRQGVSRDLAFLLMNDIKEAIAHFDRHPVSVAMTPEESGGFSHL